MAAEKYVKIRLKNGIDLRIPRNIIQRIVLPSVIINNSYFRLVIPMDQYKQNLENIKKRFNL